MKMPSTREIVIRVLQILVGLTFLFSGFTKAVDPWGTAIKLGEYFSAFGFGFLRFLDFPVAFLLPALELTLGAGLVAGAARKLVSLATLIFMLFFTVLTFVLALWNPVSDCGCFGEAVKLTNWQTFIKNALLLLAIAIVFRLTPRDYLPGRGASVFLGCMFAASMLFSGHNYYHLPVIDFLPYKVGTNLSEEMSEKAPVYNEVTLIYQDKITKKLREFAIEDPEWQDTTRWEFVDSRIVPQGKPQGAGVRDFAIFDSHGDITQEVLSQPGRVVLVCIPDLRDLKPRCAARLGKVIEDAYSRYEIVLCVTASIPPGISSLDVASAFGMREIKSIGDQPVPIYNMDATTMKTMLRAKAGIVTLEKGVITGKYNCPDALDAIPH